MKKIGIFIVIFCIYLSSSCKHREHHDADSAKLRESRETRGGNINVSSLLQLHILEENQQPIGVPSDPSKRVYYSPNEQYPKDALPILRWKERGLYLAVGSERGFMGAAASNASALLLLDYDDGIVFFNRLNVELLRAASSLEDYRFLREVASAEEWKSRAAGAGGLMQNSQSHSWWQDCVRASNRDGCHHFAVFHRSKDYWDKKKLEHRDAWGSQLPYLVPYENTNYLNERTLFTRLQELAKTGMIQSYQFDMTQIDKFRKIVSELQEKKFVLGVFDFSNTWQPEFVGPAVSAKLVDALGAIATPESAFMATILGKKWRKVPNERNFQGNQLFINPLPCKRSR